MEFEFSIIREGVRTVLVTCEELEAHSEKHGAIHRSHSLPERDDMTPHETDMARLFAAALAGHIVPPADGSVGAVSKSANGDTLHASFRHGSNFDGVHIDDLATGLLAPTDGDAGGVR
jgi:hypothetical protein